MKKNSFFAMLMALMSLSIQEAGEDKSSSADDGDIGDFELDNGDSGNQESVDDGSVKVSKDEWENVQNITQEYAREQAFKSTVDSIKSEIPEFDANKVVSKLKEIHAKDPAKAQAYNNEIGFKLLWREMTDDVAKNDAVNGGSNKESGNDFQSAFDGAMQGKDGALRKALSMAK